MPQTRFRILIVVAFVLVALSPVAAQPTKTVLEPRQSAPIVRTVDAEATREELMEVLRKHPPSVARVLKLDPTLMRNETYLGSYPALRDFLAVRPEIPQNAPYYLENVRVFEGSWQPENPRIRLLENMLGGLAGMTVFIVVICTLVWLVRTVLEQRRWNRLSRIQEAVHTKLMDRFSSNDELLGYVQTPSGRRFLESGPSPLQEEPRTIGAPFSRILWSVQVGVVLSVAGLGLLGVKGTIADLDVQQFLLVVGVLTFALGLGFIFSAAAAYGLSRKLGLFDRPAQASDHA